MIRSGPAEVRTGADDARSQEASTDGSPEAPADLRPVARTDRPPAVPADRPPEAPSGRPPEASAERPATRPVARLTLVAIAVCAGAVALAGGGRELVHLLSAAAEVGGDSWLTQCLHCTGESPSAGAAASGGGGGAGGPAGNPAGVTPEGCEEVLSQKESVGRLPSEGELQGRNVVRTILAELGIRVGAGLTLMGASAAQTNAKGLLTVKCARRIENRTLSGRRAMEAVEEAYGHDRGLDTPE